MRPAKRQRTGRDAQERAEPVNARRGHDFVVTTRGSPPAVDVVVRRLPIPATEAGLQLALGDRLLDLISDMLVEIVREDEAVADDGVQAAAPEALGGIPEPAPTEPDRRTRAEGWSRKEKTR
jgi:hypothetical protein